MLDRGRRAGRQARKKSRKPTSAVEVQLNVLMRVAERDDIRVHWNRIDTRGKIKRPILHVMFDHHGQRLVDYWPSNGTARLQGLTTKVIGVNGAYEIARRLKGRDANA